jgi:8-oxo-dGTP pyrophosphatase MutT (NUDIX family)
MENQSQLLDLFETYARAYPAERESLKPIREFVAMFDGADLYNRQNFTGHITASAFIFYPADGSVLMIKHKTLNRWLQPGGHVEETDANIFAASLREAVEETGIGVDDLGATQVIFDIDSHAIPANPRKAELAHVHHDIRYLFSCKNANPLQTIITEVAGCEWIQLDVLQQQPGFSRVAEKLSAIKSISSGG